MSSPARPLLPGRVSTVAALVEALRTRILDGELPGGTRLPEHELTTTYGVARHSVRAALRDLAALGLVRIEPNRGASVARLGAEDLQGLYALREILEVGAARIALEQGNGRLPAAVHTVAQSFAALCCSRQEPAWSRVVVAHNAVHAAIVAAAGVPRVQQAHADLSAELQLFLVQSRPHYTLRRLAADHVGLVVDLERHGPGALAEHIRLSTDALLADEGASAG
jgi:DNA-binding GntR family transcriptional regulator